MDGYATYRSPRNWKMYYKTDGRRAGETTTKEKATVISHERFAELLEKSLIPQSAIFDAQHLG